MISIEAIFNSRQHLLRYRESFFYSGPELNTFTTGLQRPVLFIANKEALKTASFFSVHTISDIDYDIYIVSNSSVVLFYLINIKTAMYGVFANGIILRRRKPSESDKEGVKTKYTLEHFHVVSNKLGTCTIFGNNITADPTT